MDKELITKDTVKRIIGLPRVLDTDKRDYGDLLIFAGKEGMAGAAILAAKAALRSGVGLVKVATPKGNFPILQRALPEAICIEEKVALSDFKHYTAIVVGPGMGTDERTARIASTVLEQAPISMPILFDADGLNVIASSEVLKRLLYNRNVKYLESIEIGEGPMETSEKSTKTAEKAAFDQVFSNLVITPHKREAARLLGCDTIDSADRLDSCVELAKMFNCVALLKGSGTLVAAAYVDAYIGETNQQGGDGWVHSTMPSVEVYQNTTGNPGMATAGSGDVLSGIIGGMLAQGIAAKEAAIAGAYIHGLAGDMVAERIGERSLIASDIIAALPTAFKRL